ncbi:hypothetical protein JXA63_03200 [Candidatus Woesebacteria bacterium]|nr:hypothetical protein [Candidatus Woesebacteria bacterium]
MTEYPVPYEEDTFDYLKVIRFIVYLYFGVFIVYLIYLLHTNGQEETIIIFKNIRNVSYTVGALFFALYGSISAIRGKNRQEKVDKVEKSIPFAIITMLLITFSYGFARFIYDGLQLLDLL